jgi:hypothetical protein
MKKKNKSLLIKAFSIISDEIPTTDKRKALKNVILMRDDLDSREKNAIFRTFRPYFSKEFDFEWLFKRAYSVIYRCEVSSDARYKKNKLQESLKLFRKEKFPVIFYLCSSYEGCSSEHKEFQGKIYVDANWKNALYKGTGTEFLISACESYIKNHGILTVQEVTDGYPYLITRPNCKHKLRALDTWTVLHNSQNKIRKMNQDMIGMGHDKKTRSEHSREYKRFKQYVKETSLR